MSVTGPRTPDTTTLLNTKLHPPHILANAISRPRLWERLDTGIDGPLTIVSAPAGYGKTTLVSSWLQYRTANPGLKLASAWLSLDERDSDLDVFLRYLCASLDRTFPGVCKCSLDMLKGPTTPPLFDLVHELSNEVDVIPHDFVLVLDDYHTLKGGTVANLLSALMRYWPPRLHMVLITRHHLDLPLATMRAKGHLTELTADDLRFTADEVENYLSQVVKVEPSGKLVEQMENQTEGWAAGLNLASLSLRRKGTIVRLSSRLDTDSNIYDYLIEDVLTREPPEIRDFLCQISMLDRWCLPLCQAITGADADQSLAALNWLERTNFFIVPLDGNREWYRFHRLLRDALRNHAVRSYSPDQLAESHRRATRWFIERGLVEEALQHALTIQDYALAAEVVESGFVETLNREDRASLERWVRLFPDTFIESHAGLLAIRSVVEQMAWSLEDAGRSTVLLRQHLTNGHARHSTLSEALLKGIACCTEAILSYFRNQMDASEALARQSLSLLPSDVFYVRGGATIFWGMAAQAAGRASLTEQAILAEYEALPDRTSNYAVRMLMALCCSALQEGRLDDAHHYASLMREKAEQGTFSLMLGWAHFWLGLIHFEWNELDEARHHFEVLTERRYTTHSQAARNGMIGLTFVQALYHDWNEAFHTLSLANQYDINLIGDESRTIRALRARLQYMRGDHTAALRWASSLIAPVPDNPLIFFLEPHLIKVRMLMAEQSKSALQREAIPILDAFDDVARRTHNVRYQVHLAAYRAIVMDILGDEEAALFCVCRALTLGKTGHFTRTFVGHGQRMQRLLIQVAEDTSAPESSEARRLLAAWGGPNQPMHVDQRIEEPLTAREVDVLMLMRERLSDKEIATRLSISVGTVKRHSANLYGKLGVNKRWDAVSRAEELGILRSI
ncbi:MAG: LuxR C-terminal-related transcriptional regulator [Anaerolineae bacterium]